MGGVSLHLRCEDTRKKITEIKKTEEQEWVIVFTNKTASILISLARRRSC